MKKSSPQAAPVVVWFRRDLRLSDNPALAAAVESGRPVIPLYILDETPGIRPPGAAALWWLDKSLAELGKALEARGSRLILRRGIAAEIVLQLAHDVGAGAVVWNRLYAPDADARDDILAKDLKTARVDVQSFNASLLLEPGAVQTKTGGPFKVYTPFWRTARTEIAPGHADPRPKHLHAPEHWPKSDSLAAWKLHPTKPDWSKGFDWTPGEDRAAAELDRFIHDDALAHYPKGRDIPAIIGSSRLSPYLHWGEIGPRQVWRSLDLASERGLAPDSAVEKFRAELGWREFNHQLLAVHPDIATKNVKSQFDHFGWRKDKRALDAWKQGRTGYPIVDAGMRQLWATGWMHNRVRMVVASFVIKHLLLDWREGEQWFWDTLVDADEANNPANWQWVAGSGADAQPFFRIFNPASQTERYDPKGDYIRQWVPELRPGGSGYPKPIVDHAEARARALAALKALPRREVAA